jgi:glycosyltransferase involved in cell wall biosynthesis
MDFFIKKWVTIFITGSEYAGERLKQVLNLDKKKHVTINNGIQRRTITLTKEQFREKYSIPENKLIASVIANLEKRKGHIFLLEAITQIKKQYTPSLIPFFIFEGDGPEKENLIKYIAENELAEHILMIDFIPSIFNLINASDFVILPSIANEDFPNVSLEAMSLGKPVIGTSIAGIPEQIENNKTGLVVKPENAEELKHAIMRLASDPIIIQQFSVEAKNRFEVLYEKSISIKKYLNLYKSLI